MLITTVVTGTWSGPDPSSLPLGSVLFELPSALVVLAAADVVVPRQASAILIAGQIALPLAANDSPGASPLTTQYRVTERIVGAPEASYWVTVPAVPTGARQVADGVAASGLAALASATAAFTTGDVGKVVFCPAFPIGATILSRTDASHVVLSAAAVASGSGLTAVIGASADLSALRPS